MLRVLVGRLAIVPLIIYAVGVPIELIAHGSLVLYADGLLPYEVVGLLACAGLVVQSFF